MLESARRVPFRAILCRGVLGRFAREIVVISVGSAWPSVCVEVVFPSLSQSSPFPLPSLARLLSLNSGWR